MVDISQMDDLSGLVPICEIFKDGYRYRVYSGDRVDVLKGDSQNPAYTVTSEGCTCPAAQYGSTKCKHRESVVFVGGGSMPAPVSNQTRDNALPEKQASEPSNIYDLL